MAAAKRFWLAIVLAIVGVVALVFGILAATIWQPAQHISASADPDEPFVMVREGVLGLYGNEVTVTLTADDPDDYVWMASGLGPDVSAWLHGHDFNVITGTESMTQLAMEKQGVGTSQSGDEQSGMETSQSDEAAQSEDVSEEPSTEDTAQAQSGQGSQSGAEPPVSPIQSDMWSNMREGKGELAVPFSAEGLSSVLLISGNGTDPAPKVTLTWEYPRPNVAAWILFPVACVFILLSIVVAIAVSARTRRLNKAKKTLSDRAAADEMATGAVPIEEVKSKLKSAPEKPSEAEVPESEESPVEQSEELQTFAPPAENEPAVVTGDAESPRPEEEASVQSERTEGGDERTELVTTESGMMNLAALQGGGRFPTRRALRDARARGVEKLVVEGVDYSTTSIPPSPKSETSLSETTIPPTSINWRSKKGAAKFGSGKPKDQK